MNVALWIIAGVLALAFFAGGLQKLLMSRERLAGSGLGFVEDFGDGAVKAIGAVEVLAAVGLVLPAALGLVPILVPVAASGLVLLMVGAAVVHLRRGETKPIIVNVALLALAAAVAVGRFGPEAFPA